MDSNHGHSAPSAPASNESPADAACQLKHVDLDHPDACPTVLAAEDRCISSGSEIGSKDGRFRILGWLQSCFFNQRLLRFPIVVCVDRCAVSIMQLKHGIDQRVRYPKGAERWPDAAHDNIGGTRAAPMIKPPIITLSPV